jgi:hypothetical protein
VAPPDALLLKRKGPTLLQEILAPVLVGICRARNFRLAEVVPSNSARRQPASILPSRWFSISPRPGSQLQIFVADVAGSFHSAFASGVIGTPGFDEKSPVIHDILEKHLAIVRSSFLEILRQAWHMLGHLRPHSRPGWWTLKRWVEIMWSRNAIG